ncbi:hypothetical protein B0H13DRAFT_1872389 [Mycena leptocephala]|nr:hypothetical protein B0H13DRAFT_1872389 [Mycena leptocephala]
MFAAYGGGVLVYVRDETTTTSGACSCGPVRGGRDVVQHESCAARAVLRPPRWRSGPRDGRDGGAACSRIGGVGPVRGEGGRGGGPQACTSSADDTRGMENRSLGRGARARTQARRIHQGVRIWVRRVEVQGCRGRTRWTRTWAGEERRTSRAGRTIGLAAAQRTVGRGRGGRRSTGQEDGVGCCRGPVDEYRREEWEWDSCSPIISYESHQRGWQEWDSVPSRMGLAF